MATSAYSVELLQNQIRGKFAAITINFGDVDKAFHGDLLFIVSGASYVNAIGIAPLVVSALWYNLMNGTEPFSYSWTGSAAALPASTTQVTIVVSGAVTQSRRIFSAIITDALQKTIQRQFFVTVTQVRNPTPFDGHIVTESQTRRRIFPI